MSNTILKSAAGVAALVAIAFGASAIAGASGSSSSTSSGARAGFPGAPPNGASPNGAPGRPPAGFGRPVTGTTAAKVKAAALAKYPGTIERIMGLPNGGYMAHVLTSGGGEQHVLVNSKFEVTGVATGPPGGGPPGGGMRGGPPPGSAAPPRPGTSS
jgi:hypothetical protein